MQYAVTLHEKYCGDQISWIEQASGTKWLSVSGSSLKDKSLQLEKLLCHLQVPFKIRVGEFLLRFITVPRNIN